MRRSHRLEVLEEGVEDLPTIYSQLADIGSNKREHESGAWEERAERRIQLPNTLLWELGWNTLFVAIMQRRGYEPQRSSQKENNTRRVYER